MRFYQYYESIITILLHFDSCPAKAIIIWINKEMSILPTQFRGFNKITGQRF